MMKKTKSFSTLLSSLGLVGVTAAAFAGESGVSSLKPVGQSSAPSSVATTGAISAAAAAPTGWEVTGAAGLNVADGNAESLSYSAQLLATRITELDETYLSADYFYADSLGQQTTNALRLGAQQNRLLSDRFYVGGIATYLNDQVADINYRVDLGTLAGYYLIKDSRTKLSVEAGPGYAWQDLGGVKDDFVTLRFAEKFSHRISSRSKIWQSAVFSPRVNDFNDYLLTMDLGLDTQISNQWAVRTYVRHQIDNTPAAGRGKGDTSVMLGLAYSLAGFPEPPAEGRRTLKVARKPKTAAAMGWTTTANANYVMASGNSDNAQYNVGVASAYRSSEHEVLLGLSQTMQQDQGATTISRILGSAQYNKMLSSVHYVGVGTSYLRDQIADISYRFTPAVIAGMYLAKSDQFSLSVEAGPGMTMEKVGGLKDSYLSVQAAERMSWAVNDRCAVGQTSIYNGEAADLQNYILTNTAFLDTDLTDSIAWRVAVSYIYDNTPALGLERHDTVLSTGIAVSF